MYKARFGAGDTIMSDTESGIYFVISGSVRVQVFGRDKQAADAFEDAEPPSPGAPSRASSKLETTPKLKVKRRAVWDDSISAADCQTEVARATKMAFWQYSKGAPITAECDEDAQTLLPIICDQQLVFGTDTTLTVPRAFFPNKDSKKGTSLSEILKTPQSTDRKSVV